MAIILTRQSRARENLTGCVPINPEAEMIIRRISRLSGIPLRQVLSEIIIQSEEELKVISPDGDFGDA